LNPVSKTCEICNCGEQKCIFKIVTGANGDCEGAQDKCEESPDSCDFSEDLYLQRYFPAGIDILHAECPASINCAHTNSPKGNCLKYLEDVTDKKFICISCRQGERRMADGVCMKEENLGCRFIERITETIVATGIESEIVECKFEQPATFPDKCIIVNTVKVDDV
jgi:hypothetical protein